MWGQWEPRCSIHARHKLNDEAFGYLSRVIVTPAVDPRLIESLQRNDSEHWAEFTFSQHLQWPSEGYVSTRQSGSP